MAFQVQTQREEGGMWRRVFVAGHLLTVPTDVQWATFEAAVQQAPGWYVLLPVDVAGRLSGDPLDMVVVGDPEAARAPGAEASPAETGEMAGDSSDGELRTP